MAEKKKKTTIKKVAAKNTTKKEKKTVLEEEIKEVKKKKSIKERINGMSLNQIVSVCTLIIAILLIILIGVSYKNTKTKNGKDIVVKVNGKTVTADDLYSNLKKTYGNQVAIDMIDEYIINKEYKTTKEMKEAAESTLSQLKSNYGNQFESIISYYGASNEEELKEIIIKQNKISKITKDYIKNNLTNKEMKDYYNTSIVGDVKASHILIGIDVDDDASDEEKEKAYEAANKTAKEVIRKLNNGEKFEELAKKYSTDEGTKDNGGDLGYFNKGQMVSEFESAVYALNVNEYTKSPIKTEYGYHIILKTGQKDKPTFKEAKSTIIEKLVEEKSSDDTIYYKALDNLRKKYKMSIKDKTIKKAYNDTLKENLSTTTTSN